MCNYFINFYHYLLILGESGIALIFGSELLNGYLAAQDNNHKVAVSLVASDSNRIKCVISLSIQGSTNLPTSISKYIYCKYHEPLHNISSKLLGPTNPRDFHHHPFVPETGSLLPDAHAGPAEEHFWWLVDRSPLAPAIWYSPPPKKKCHC